MTYFVIRQADLQKVVEICRASAINVKFGGGDAVNRNYFWPDIFLRSTHKLSLKLVENLFFVTARDM